MEKVIYDCVYLENEFILRRAWENAAKKKGISLLTLDDPQELLKRESEFSKEKTAFYLDSDLGEGKLKGEEIASFLKEKGYTQIFLASGHEAEHFKHLTWLKVVGKRPPW